MIEKMSGKLKILVPILLIAMMLTTALTIHVEASTKKSSKPIVRTVNGTVLVNYPENKKAKKVTFKFYAKEKGKWVMKTHDNLSPGTPSTKDNFTYQEVMKNGTYAVTATADKLKQSDKTFFKIKNVGKNKSPSVFRDRDYISEAMEYKALMEVPTEPKKGSIRVEWNYQSKSTWQVFAILYYIDSKGKLHLVGKKPLKFHNDGGIHRNEATFKTVKGQRDYALAQANRDGKILGYDFFHYDKGQNQAYPWRSHAGHPSASMKFKKSDWRLIDGYIPKTNSLEKQVTP